MFRRNNFANFIKAVESGDKENVKKYIEKCVKNKKINKLNREDPRDGQTALRKAAFFNKPEIVALLIPHVRVNDGDSIGQTALFIAVLKRHPEALRELLNAPNIDTHCVYGLGDPLSVAREMGFRDIENLLVNFRSRMYQTNQQALERVLTDARQRRQQRRQQEHEARNRDQLEQNRLSWTLPTTLATSTQTISTQTFHQNSLSQERILMTSYQVHSGFELPQSSFYYGNHEYLQSPPSFPSVPDLPITPSTYYGNHEYLQSPPTFPSAPDLPITPTHAPQVSQSTQPTFEERLDKINFTSDIPDHLQDPISYGIINDPITVSSGIIYDRETLKQYFASKGNPLTLLCPRTRKPISINELSNPTVILIKGLLEEFVKKEEEKMQNPNLSFFRNSK